MFCHMLVAFFAALVLPCCSEQRVVVQRGSSMQLRGRAAWWPFPASEGGAAEKHTSANSLKPAPRLADVKDSVMMTAAFGHKTAALCVDALSEDQMRCKQIAGARLFCALMRRHAEQYDSMEGAEQEKQKCESVDIMENAVEAAKDVREQEDAARG